jgi:hypothetical protein
MCYLLEKKPIFIAKLTIMKTKIFLLTLGIVFSYYSHAQTNCSGWLNLQNRFAAVTTGDLDITGNKVTVEAKFMMTGSSVNIVSKHLGGNDCNYLLRPGRGEISTDVSGFVFTGPGSDPCLNLYEMNRIYHVALVYDGATLKYYSNGILISQVPCTGNLKTNNWNTAIGEHAVVVTPTLNGSPNPNYQSQNEGMGYYDESFRGYINEVRIWNVARTQEQIFTYMNSSLPNPTTQIGLKGYYVLNSLQNLQGNAAYNGTIEGLAQTNQTINNCFFLANQCSPLPVELKSFNAFLLDNKRVSLDWDIEGIDDLSHFELQRTKSSNGLNFEKIAQVVAYRNQPTTKYSYIDNTVFEKGTFLYRLKIIDKNGTTKYSEVRSVFIANEGNGLISLFPNPAQNDVTVTIKTIAEIANLDVTNASGQVVVRKVVSPLQPIVKLDMSGQPKGVYFVNFTTKSAKQTVKFIRQ